MIFSIINRSTYFKSSRNSQDSHDEWFVSVRERLLLVPPAAGTSERVSDVSFYFCAEDSYKTDQTNSNICLKTVLFVFILHRSIVSLFRFDTQTRKNT